MASTVTPILYEIVRRSYTTGRVTKIVARDIPHTLIDGEVRAWQRDPRLRRKSTYYSKRFQRGRRPRRHT